MLPARALLLLSCLSLAACPDEPSGDDGGCPLPGATPAITLAPDQGDADVLVDGAVVPVFPPPQGGVFTELDVELTGVDADDVEQLRIEITDASGPRLATQVYFGSGLPLRCIESGALTIDALPVGFDESVELSQLDGVAITLAAIVTTADDTFRLDLSLVLEVTEF